MNQYIPCRNPAIRHLPDVANISLGFLPLNHLLGRMAIVQCMVSGGYTAFVRALAFLLHGTLFCLLCRLQSQRLGQSLRL